MPGSMLSIIQICSLSLWPQVCIMGNIRFKLLPKLNRNSGSVRTPKQYSFKDVVLCSSHIDSEKLFTPVCPTRSLECRVNTAGWITHEAVFLKKQFGRIVIPLGLSSYRHIDW